MEFDYFIYPALKELETATDPKRRRELRARIAANIYSPDALDHRVEGLGIDELVADTEHEEKKSADDLIIDSFIEKFGRPGQKELDTPLLPEHSGTTDYFASTSSTDIAHPEETESEYAAPKKRGKKKDAKSPAETQENDTEWLQAVKKMVKNADYNGAIAFINQNYLNNPEKSIYFADQIRFIKKMMLNEERKRN